MKKLHYIQADSPWLPSHPSGQGQLCRLPSQTGVSLVELMVAIALGLMILSAIGLLFANNSRVRQETEKTSQQIENGRYAIKQLVDNIRLAGYYGEFSPV